jgi:hypothetical protein
VFCFIGKPWVTVSHASFLRRWAGGYRAMDQARRDTLSGGAFNSCSFPES